MGNWVYVVGGVQTANCKVEFSSLKFFGCEVEQCVCVCVCVCMVCMVWHWAGLGWAGLCRAGWWSSKEIICIKDPASLKF